MLEKKVIRVNVEVVYDDGTFDEVALDKPRVTQLYSALNVSTGHVDHWQSFELQGYRVP